jgi:hypothetical protein
MAMTLTNTGPATVSVGAGGFATISPNAPTGWTLATSNASFSTIANFVDYTTGMISYRTVETVADGRLSVGREYALPDGSKLTLDAQGNYRLDDKDAKVVYKGNRVREFSPYLNASDLIAKFVEYAGTLRVRQDEVLGLPLELFVNWLVIEAAERDGDPVPETVERLPTHPRLRNELQPKCLRCGRYVPRAYHRRRFDFCSPEHGAEYARRLMKALPPPAEVRGGLDDEM